MEIHNLTPVSKFWKQMKTSLNADMEKKRTIHLLRSHLDFFFRFVHFIYKSQSISFL